MGHGKGTTWFWEHESAASQAKYKEVTGEKYGEPGAGSRGQS